MKIEADVKLTSKDLFDFMMYHTYAGFNGKFSILIGLLVIVVAAVTFGKVDLIYSVMYVVFGVIFIIYTPVSLKMRASRQFLSSPVFKQGIAYTFSDTGITSAIGEEQMEVLWDNVYKVVQSKGLILIYTTRVNASILPKSELGEKYEDILAMIKQHVKSSKIKGC